MLMNEIFNSSVQLTWKNKADDEAVALFYVDEKEYECIIEAGTYVFENKTLTFLSVAFARIKDGARIFDITNDTKNPGMIYGAVINGLAKKIKEYQADAVVFGAVKDVERRMRIYTWVAQRFAKQFGIWIKSVKTQNGEMSILINSDLDKTLTDNFQAFIKQKNVDKYDK